MKTIRSRSPNLPQPGRLRGGPPKESPCQPKRGAWGYPSLAPRRCLFDPERRPFRRTARRPDQPVGPGLQRFGAEAAEEPEVARAARAVPRERRFFAQEDPARPAVVVEPRLPPALALHHAPDGLVFDDEVDFGGGGQPVGDHRPGLTSLGAVAGLEGPELSRRDLQGGELADHAAASWWRWERTRRRPCPGPGRATAGCRPGRTGRAPEPCRRLSSASRPPRGSRRPPHRRRRAGRSGCRRPTRFRRWDCPASRGRSRSRWCRSSSGRQ